MSSWCTQYTQDLGHGSETLKFAMKGAESSPRPKHQAAKDNGKKSTGSTVLFQSGNVRNYLWVV